MRLDGLGAARAIVPIANQVWLGGDNGLYLSEDFGETWAPVSLTKGIRSLLLSRWPAADPTVYAGTGDGLLRSRDGGRTFAPTALSGTAVHRLEWPGPALVVACDRGLVVTRDEGAHFAGPGQGLPAGPVQAMALSSYFTVDPVAFAAPASGGVYRSSDGGATWKASGLSAQVVGDLVWLGPFLYAAGRARVLPQPGRRGQLDAARGEPRAALAADVPARAGRGPRGLPGHRPGPLPVDGRRGALGRRRGSPASAVLTVATFPPPEPTPGKKSKR